MQRPVVVTKPSVFYNSTNLAPTAEEAFVASARLRASWYRLGAPFQQMAPGHGAVMIPFGDDMKFQNADKQFSNMDRLIKGVNERFGELGVHMRYGTLADYIAVVSTADAALRPAAGAACGDEALPHAEDEERWTWPTYGGDFMPLATNYNQYSDDIQPEQPDWNFYWSGFFSTRPLLKGFAARAGAAKHVAEIAATLACSSPSKKNSSLCADMAASTDMQVARDVNAVTQHHDHITGTSLAPVVADLDVRLQHAYDASVRILSASLNDGLTTNTTMPDGGSGAQSGATVASAGSHVRVWNALAQSTRRYVTLTLALTAPPNATWQVLDAQGEALLAVVVPPPPRNNASDSIGSDHSTLVFLCQLGALAAEDYTVVLAPSSGFAPSWQCSTRVLNTTGDPVFLLKSTQ